MSTKFLDDHRILKGKRSELPGENSQAYDAGHVFQDRVDGTRFVNQGTLAHGAIFTSPLANRHELVERFEKTPILNADILITATAPTLAQMALIWRANPNFEVLGTNMTTALCTHSTGGGITLTTAGADEDQGIVTPHLDALATSWATTDWSTDDKVIFETNIKTAANISDLIIWAGLKLTNDNVVATDNEQAFVRYEAGVASGVFQLITSDNGTDTTTNTTVTVAVSTDYHIKLVVNGDRDVILFINGVQVARVAAALGTAHDLIPYIGLEAGAAAAKAITVRGLKLSKDFND